MSVTIASQAMALTMPVSHQPTRTNQIARITIPGPVLSSVTIVGPGPGRSGTATCGTGGDGGGAAAGRTAGGGEGGSVAPGAAAGATAWGATSTSWVSSSVGF